LSAGDPQVKVWHAIGLAAAGDVEAAHVSFGEAVAVNERWTEFVRRFIESRAQPELVDAAARLLDA
jgi:hypothetical protein